ncbi:MAG: L,D-transpeptidase family protein [Gammaproteobacteria bacterium]|nr:L,D-transpeptidase family protein [Gammaproteobacteria bacterium]
MNTRANTSITAAAVAVSVWLTTAGAAPNGVPNDVLNSVPNGVPNGVPNNGAVAREQAEVELSRAIESLVSGRGQEALETLSGLLERHPNFRIAAMAYADLLAAQAQQQALLPLGDGAKRRLADLLNEAKARVRHRPANGEHLPANIVRLSDRHRHALLFDAARSRLYLFENHRDAPLLVADYYASYGKGGMDKNSEGDNRTPTGVYRITHRLNDDGLAELYGAGAWPLDYPNAWDRVHRRSGHGIWLHGVPRITYSRPPQASRGCIVASNEVIGELRRMKLGGAPVILASDVAWLEREHWQRRRDGLLGAIRQWQDDWQSLDVEKYLAHYSGDYRDGKQDYRQMTARTRRNARAKTFIKVGVGEVDLLMYSQTPELFVARFNQDYRSNNYNIAYRKQQFWKKENGAWKIVFEGRV